METQESHPTTTRTTVSISEECIVLLDIFSEHQPRWTEDQLARFKIWSASLGVFENGHASIDYRLRDHPDVLNLVTQQLDVLRINLEELNSSVSEPMQSHVQKRVTSGSEVFDVEGEEFVYESPTSEASFSSTTLEVESKGYQDTKLSEGLQIVEETIARLNALSTAIRRSGKQSRTSKADLYEVIEYVDGAKINVTQEFQKYASAIVAREIPGAEHFLKERLAVSIARRRNRFLYWKRHDKTSKIYVKKVIPSRLVKELQITQQANMPQAEDQSFDKQNRMRDEKTIMTGFTATTFDAKNFRRPTESARGSIKPTGSVRWKNREEFPKPPKIGIKESHFICPICLILSPAEEAKGDLWVQHVTRDLKPYICVFESCETPQTVFDNFQDWIGHMKKEQMAPEWYCASASHPPARFDSQGLFESHMREKHPGGFSETQLPALAQRNMGFASQVFTCCPFCSYGQNEDHLTHYSTLRNQDELQHHISSHLLSLAFISLPSLNAGDSSNSESGGSSRAALDSRIGQSEPMEHLQFDDVSHDPNTVESPIQPTGDWDWEFVGESLGKRPVTDEDSPDSVLSRLWKMQQKLASKQHFTSDDSVDHQREAFNEGSPQAPLREDSKLATMENPGSTSETRKSTEKIEGALPSPVVEGAVPLIPRYDEAERVQRLTVEDRQKTLGPDHPETLTSLNNLAQALFFKGQYKEAAVLYRQALAGREKILGQGHLDTIKSLNNLAQALVYLGQFKAAEELYRKALVQGEVTLGLEHPYVLQNIHNLGGALQKQGRNSEAEKLYRQALIGREKVLGPEHPDTLQSVNNLGGAFEKMGRYEAAERQYRQALAAREKVWGPDDAETLQSVHNVAGVLRNQGRYTEAETLYRKALAGREKTLGRNHPNTLKSLNNLALALEKQGKYVEAEQIYRQALAVREEVLGNEHPDTFQSINNLGSVRLSRLDYTEAELLYRQALEGRKKILGSDHPATLESVSNLGKALEKLDRLEEAEVQYREALDGRMKVLGQGHPHTVQSAKDLICLFNKGGQP